MKRSIFGIMFAALLTLSLSVVARATTTDELIISSGGDTCTIVDNGGAVTGSCGTLSTDESAADGTDTVTGSLNGWIIDFTSGTSYSPSLLPFGLDLSALTASCTGSCTAANALTVEYTDQNFTSPGPFASGFSDTLLSGAGTASQSAYYSNTNALGDTTTQIGTTLTFSGTNAGTVSGGAGATSPYSLTLVQTFSGNASFSTDGGVTGVPEGWSLSSSLGMLGFGVIALVFARRRGLVKTTV